MACALATPMGPGAQGTRAPPSHRDPQAQCSLKGFLSPGQGSTQSSQQEAPSGRPVSSDASLTGEETRPLKCQGSSGSGKGPSACASCSSPGAAGGCTHSAFPRRGRLPACSSEGNLHRVPKGHPDWTQGSGLWARRGEGGL